MNQLAMNSPEMSECDILHTLRWSSRLRIPTYVTWIKVPQWNVELSARSSQSQCPRGFWELFNVRVMKALGSVLTS